MARGKFDRLIAQIVDHIDDMTRRIGDTDDIIKDYMGQYESAIAAIDGIPGIARRSAEVIIAEIGADMGRFPTAGHLCSWAGIYPGNHKSAGKRQHGKATKGNKALKSIYHILKDGVAFHDLGSDYYDNFNRQHKINGYLKRLAALGWSPETEAAAA